MKNETKQRGGPGASTWPARIRMRHVGRLRICPRPSRRYGKQFIERLPGHFRDQCETWQAEQALALRQCAGRGSAAVSGEGRRDHGRLEKKLPLGLSNSQRQVRNRCDELAKSMEKVLARRPDEERPVDSWKYVKIRVTPAAVKEPGRQPGRWRRPGKRSGTACAVIFRAAHGRPGSRSGLMRCGRGTRRRRRKKRCLSAHARGGAVMGFLHEKGRPGAPAVRAEGRALGAGRSERRHRLLASA